MVAGPNQASQHSSMDEGRAHDPPIPLAEDIDSKWLLGEGGQFLLKCGPWCIVLQGMALQPCVFVSQTGLSELKNKVGREGMRPDEVRGKNGGGE